MFIDVKLAKELMHEVNEVLPNYCSIMDSTGRILICTDSAREGTYHDGTKKILGMNLDELVVSRDGEYPGVLKGMIFPIHLDSEVVGFFGLAGEAGEIRNHGRIIVKLIGILVSEKLDAYYKERSEKAKRNLIEVLVEGKDVSEYPMNTLELLTQYGMDKSGPFSVAIINVLCAEDSVPTDFARFKKSITLNDLTEQFTKHSGLAAVFRKSCVVISNQPSQKLYPIIKKVSANVMSQFESPLLCAIGGTYKHYDEIPKSYNEALSVIRFRESQGCETEGIYYYDPKDIDFIIRHVSESHLAKLTDSVFAGCEDKEVDDFKEFIIAYFKCNGSLNQISKQYYIHKNTVQYKIQKIYSKTGLDPRVANDLFILYMAAVS